MAKALLFFILTALNVAVWAGGPQSLNPAVPFQNWVDADQDKRQQMLELFNNRQDVIFAELNTDCQNSIPIHLSMLASEPSLEPQQNLADMALRLQSTLQAQSEDRVSVTDSLSLKALVSFTNRVISHDRCAIAQDPTLGALCSGEFSGHQRRPHDFGERTRISRRLRLIEDTQLNKDRALRIIDDFFYWQSFTLCMYMPQIESAYEQWANDSLPESPDEVLKEEASIRPRWSNPFFN